MKRTRIPTKARHRFLEHTGELELMIEAPDFPALLEEAACALAEVMAEDAAGEPTSAPERVELRAPDRASLLVDWLNELVYRSELGKCIYGKATIDSASDRHLEATIHGRVPSSPRTAVKAATWHRLGVRDVPEGLRATVVLDV